MSALLEVRGLCVAYGKVEAVHQAGLRVQESRIVTVIGPNGAGKTTLLAALMGMLATRGSVSYLGQEITRVEPEQRVSRGMCLVPERRELFAAMTVEDNLVLGAFHRYHKRDKAIAGDFEKVYQLFPRLKERRGQLAGTLSGGERQMLALGRALMSRPRSAITARKRSPNPPLRRVLPDRRPTPAGSARRSPGGAPEAR